MQVNDTKRMEDRTPCYTVEPLPSRQHATTPIEGIFTVDVEDWFHILDIPGAPRLVDWAGLESHVERDFTGLLDFFSEKNATVTCFFLGWVAEQFPHLVRDAARRGHEIASHGYSHRLTYELSRQEFYQDVFCARQILENIVAQPVLGYRSPGFSMSPWFFETLVDAGYQYDASIFPAPHGHGGMRTAIRAAHRATQNRKSILEFPVSVVDLMGKPLCFCGGGYLRLLPYRMIHHFSKQVLRENRPVVFYIHPREINPNHPRLAMSMARRFRSYVNLHSTKRKLSQIFDDFHMTSFRGLLASNPQWLETTTPLIS